jgi:hypothetical protein
MEHILLECGLSLSRCQHITRTIDRLRLCGLGGDDLAAMLLRWRQEAVERRWRGFEAQQKCRPGLLDVPGLFDVLEEKGRTRREG